MKKYAIVLIMIWLTAMPVSALDMSAPIPPETAQEYLPAETESFGEGLLYVIRRGAETLFPEIQKASVGCVRVLCASMMVMLVRCFPGNTKSAVDLVGTVGVGVLLLGSAGTLIEAAKDTIQQMSDYGKLLLPVMTASLAAQGGVTSSTAIYAGTAFFDAALGSVIRYLLIPMLYVFLFLSTAGVALGNDMMKRARDTVKGIGVWLLKTLLYIFTGYISITGVVSGAADHAAMKATKLTISGAVPVIGGILSDASEAVLVGAGVVKSSTGIYGLLAVLAICIGPFIKIGVQYLMLKLTAAMCGMFGGSGIHALTENFADAMGMLLAMTGTMCLLLIISIVCFLKGMS